jgi:hypothetical protein
MCLRKRPHLQTLDLGTERQMVFLKMLLSRSNNADLCVRVQRRTCAVIFPIAR